MTTNNTTRVRPPADYNPRYEFPSLTTIATTTGATLLFAASAGITTYWAWTTGQQHGLGLALLFGAAALGSECLKPIAVNAAFQAAGQWNAPRTITLLLLATVTIAFSLSSGLSFSAQTRQDMASARSSGNEARQRLVAAHQRYTAELAALPPARPNGTINGEIAALLKVRGANRCLMINGPISRNTCRRVDLLKAERATAAERRKLAAKIEAVSSRLTAAPDDRQADPLASAITVYAASLGWSFKPADLTTWLSLLLPLLLEIGSSLGLVMICWTASDARGRHNDRLSVELAKGVQTPETKVSTPVMENDGQPPAPPSTPSVPSVRGHDARRGLLRLIEGAGGKLDASQRAIAKALDVSKSHVNDVIAELVDAGRISAQTNAKGTRLALA